MRCEKLAVEDQEEALQNLQAPLLILQILAVQLGKEKPTNTHIIYTNKQPMKVKHPLDYAHTTQAVPERLQYH